MLYIFGKTISTNKQLIYILTQIFGINIFTSKTICKYLGFNPFTNINLLKKQHINNLIVFIDKNLIIEHELKKWINEKLNFLLLIKTIRGIRNSLGLPVNGQWTHTNAKTKKKFKIKNY